MTKDNDGGLAFPGQSKTKWILGMTLRDFFAAKAMQGLICDPDREKILKTATITAGTAYFIADAMIAERDKEA